MSLVVLILRGCAVLLRTIAFPFIAIGWVAAGCATPILWLAGWCTDRAREWDPRLWQRGQHTDLHPPPGA